MNEHDYEMAVIQLLEGEGWAYLPPELQPERDYRNPLLVEKLRARWGPMEAPACFSAVVYAIIPVAGRCSGGWVFRIVRWTAIGRAPKIVSVRYASIERIDEYAPLFR